MITSLNCLVTTALSLCRRKHFSFVNFGKQLKLTLTLCLTIAISSCKSIPDVRNEYQGQDAGRIAIGIGATANTHYTNYSLIFRRVGEKDPKRFTYFQHNDFSAQKRDYENEDENGVVQSFQLEPGDYEIFNFDIFLSGAVQRNFGSRMNISIPFSVRPHQTTYLGNYQANVVRGENVFGMAMPAGAVFVVSDREKVDLALVRKRIPNVSFGVITNATPAVRAIASPFFIGR